MLAGEPDAESARQRCVQLLGSRSKWIAQLVREIVGRFSEDWRDTWRHDMAKAITESPTFNSVRQRTTFRLRNIPLTPPRMAPMPVALSGCVVPNLPTPLDVARWLNLSMDELIWLTGPLGYVARNDLRTKHYHYRWIAKRTGGVRLLEIPQAHLCALQRRILHQLLEYVPLHEAAHGFRKRHSCVTNARPHLGQAVVIRMDLADFFGSIGGGKVYRVFTTLGYPAAVAQALTRLTTHATAAKILTDGEMGNIESASRVLGWREKKRLATPHLPQGAPTSPVLANLCAFNFDVRVQALADEFGATYTRYADDLTFSGGEAFGRRARAFESYVAAIALEEGFSVNHRKTHVMSAGSRQRVTGIVVNRKTNIPREHYDRLKAMLHNCLRHGPNKQTAMGVSVFKNHLAGHIAQVAAIHPTRGARLKRMYDQVRWNDEIAISE